MLGQGQGMQRLGVSFFVVETIDCLISGAGMCRGARGLVSCAKEGGAERAVPLRDMHVVHARSRLQYTTGGTALDRFRLRHPRRPLIMGGGHLVGRVLTTGDAGG